MITSRINKSGFLQFQPILAYISSMLSLSYRKFQGLLHQSGWGKRMEERVMPSKCSVDKRTIYHVFLNGTRGRPLHVHLISSIDSTIDIHMYQLGR